MKKLLLLVVASMMSIGVYAQVKPQPTTLPINIGAELADNITVTKVSDVYFGGIYIPKTADVVVTMDPTGLVRVSSGTTTLYNQSSQRLGSIKIDATENDTFKITAPSTVNLALQSPGVGQEGAEPLVYTPTFYGMDNQALDLTAASLTYARANHSLISVAGTLAVKTTSYRGTYSGTMNVTVTWL